MSTTKGTVTRASLQGIADGIRYVNGSNTEYLPSEMGAAVRALKKTLVSKTATANGTYNPEDDNADGYDEFIVDVQSGGGAVVQPLSVTQNGTYNPPSGVDGYAPVTVNVSGGGVNRKTQAEWDALSFSERKALGLTMVGGTTDITGKWYDYSLITCKIDLLTVAGDGTVGAKTVNVTNYAEYDKLAVFVAVSDNNTNVIEIDGVLQPVTESSSSGLRTYFCATLVSSKPSITVRIDNGDGGSAMYSVAVYGIVGSLVSFANHATYVSGTSSTIAISTDHSAAIVDVMTDRVSGTCMFDRTSMALTPIGRGYFGDLYHAYLIVYGLSAGTKELSGPSGIKCFQVLSLD